MSSTYAGNANNYPDDFLLPDDADPPTASALNIPSEALGDRTAYLKARTIDLDVFSRCLTVMNFHKAAVAGITLASAPFYNAALRLWVAPGVEVIKISLDCGISWSDAPFLPSLTGIEFNGGDSDAAGNMVISSDSRYCVTYNYATSTYAKVDVLGLAPGIAIPSQRVVYDPVHAKWVWFAAHENLHKVKTSSDRSTWTTAVEPSSVSSWGDDHLLLRMVCNPNTGRIVAIAYQDGGSASSVATSDDGGATWTVRADIAVPSNSTSASLHYDALADEWLYSCGSITGTATSKVYRSTDGATWTLATSLTTNCIHGVTTVGGLWVGIAAPDSGSPNAVFSTNKGATWSYAGFAAFTSGGGSGSIYTGSGGLVIPTSGAIFSSMRVGTPSEGVLT